MKIVSLFSGCGGLDLGFEKAGYQIIWSNENDKTIHETYQKNFPNTIIDKRSISKIPSNEIPDCDGIIGGPPCQAWSAAGAQRGFNDSRGRLFLDFIRVIKDKQPKFFVAENVKGLLSKTKKESLDTILNLFKEAGYNISYKLFKTSNHGIAQDRERIVLVGMRNVKFNFDIPLLPKKTLRDVIYNIKNTVVKSNGWLSNPNVIINSHEYLPEEVSGYSSQYMSRNRVKGWDECGYTVVCSARHITIHPDCLNMEKVSSDVYKFVDNAFHRRLSVRECARIQSFPDSFLLYYPRIIDGYKMIGNAVPPDFAFLIATNIMKYKLDMIECFDTFLWYMID